MAIAISISGLSYAANSALAPARAPAGSFLIAFAFLIGLQGLTLGAACRLPVRTR